MCYDETKRCVQNIDIALGVLMSIYNWKGLGNHLEETRIYIFIFGSSFCISNPILKLEMTI